LKKIKIDCTENEHNQFLKFLRYFEYTYLGIYKSEYWNYYDNVERITNNASESYNNYLNNLFEKKISFFKLIHTLKKEESLSYEDYKLRSKGNREKKSKKKGRTDQINALIKLNKNKESLSKLNKRNDDDYIKLWIQCLVILKYKF